MINIVDAIQSLRPGAIWTYHHGKDNFEEALIWQDETQTKPSESEIQAEMTRLQADYDSKEYQRLRAAEYPSITDQLDMIWHMMNNETIPGKGSDWYNTILDVKNRYTKDMVISESNQWH